MQTVSRLIHSFAPESYDLSLTLEREKRTFHGIVTIKGQSKTAGELRLHSKDLTIESVTFDGKQADFTHADNDELIITHSDLTVAAHIIVISFSGSINDEMHGLYPCYFDHAGIKKELLATQFESHHAREVFPCIDEPEAKATFDVTLTTEENITVLGNMPVKHQTTENERLVTSFETTPLMSVYLLAWVTGELHRKTTTTDKGVEVNVYATPAQSPESLDYALDVAARTIEFYEQYFDTEYPLPKSDHVALPDFSSGAMENWGLITYREIALLADPKTTSISSKQYVATVVAHELAHQWFGNLVTMKWWNNLWLNESFANLMEYIAIDALHPEWNMWLEFSTSESIAALRRDAIDGVQPVQLDVNHPDEISTLFDGAIVYAKGARLMRMLQQYVGDSAFQEGLKSYFKNHAYSNTEADDLWSELEKSSGKPVVSLMNTWLTQPGYPVLHVSQDGDQVTLTQEQFYIGPNTPSGALWPIPLNSSCSEMPELLETGTATITRHHTTSLRFNVGDSAHFLTHYSQPILAQLIAEVKAGTLSPLDRLQLLHESTLLARGGVMPSSDLVDLIEAYANETEEPVWVIIGMAIGELKKFVEDDPTAEKQLRTFSGTIATAEYERLGWTSKANESEDDSKLRATIIGLTLYSENEDVITQAKHLYEENSLEELDPELRTLIISTVARYGDGSIVDTLLNVYKTTALSELQNDIAYGVTSTRVPEKITQLIESIKNADIVRPQDAFRWFVYLIRTRDSRTKTWAWIRDNWQWVIDTFGGDKSYDDYPRLAASALVTAKQLQEYKDFFEPKKDIVALTRVITMGISEIGGRVALIERDGPAVRERLAQLKK